MPDQTKIPYKSWELNRKLPVDVTKCVVLKGYGGYDKVEVRNGPVPSPGPNEVLIRVMACGISFNDIMIRQGLLDKKKKTPFIMGSECAGYVMGIGDGVDQFQVGHRVLAVPEFGAWSEFVVVHTDLVYFIPSNVEYAEAVALFVSYVSAVMVLEHQCSIASAQSAFIHSVYGAMGDAMSQICKLNNPSMRLYGTASSDKSDIRAARFHKVLDRNCDYVAAIKGIEGQEDGVDVVIDSRGGDDANKAISLMKPGGKVILFGSSNLVTGETRSLFGSNTLWFDDDKVDHRAALLKGGTVGTFCLRDLLYKHHIYDGVRKAYSRVLELFNDGKIKLAYDSCCSFLDIVPAMKRMQNRRSSGKIILLPSYHLKTFNPDTRHLCASAAAAQAQANDEADEQTEALTGPGPSISSNGKDVAGPKQGQAKKHCTARFSNWFHWGRRMDEMSEEEETERNEEMTAVRSELGQGHQEDLSQGQGNGHQENIGQGESQGEQVDVDRGHEKNEGHDQEKNEGQTQSESQFQVELLGQQDVQGQIEGEGHLEGQEIEKAVSQHEQPPQSCSQSVEIEVHRPHEPEPAQSDSEEPHHYGSPGSGQDDENSAYGDAEGEKVPPTPERGTAEKSPSGTPLASPDRPPQDEQSSPHTPEDKQG